MRKALIGFLIGAWALIPVSSQAQDASTNWFQRTGDHLENIWTTGSNDLYMSGWAWHNRSTYSAKKIRSFNETAWGGGYGRSIYDQDGDWQGLYAMAFLDSHRNVQPIAGYGFLKLAHLPHNWRLGAGYTVFLTARKDIFSYIPFPGVLPLVSVGYRDAALYATYIPGGAGAGNVLFAFGRWSF